VVWIGTFWVESSSWSPLVSPGVFFAAWLFGDRAALAFFYAGGPRLRAAGAAIFGGRLSPELLVRSARRCGSSSARLLCALLVRRPPVRGVVLAVSVCVFFLPAGCAWASTHARCFVACRRDDDECPISNVRCRVDVQCSMSNVRVSNVRRRRPARPENLHDHGLRSATRWRASSTRSR
jgi:hypothetical protein